MDNLFINIRSYEKDYIDSAKEELNGLSEYDHI
jgi:hypothetical protein